MNSNVQLGNPDIVIRRNPRVAAAMAGLTEADIEGQLQAALYGQVASTLPEHDRITNIRVRYPDSIRFDPDRLGRLAITLPTNTSATAPKSANSGPASAGFVALGQVASIESVRSPNELWRGETSNRSLRSRARCRRKRIWAASIESFKSGSPS